MVDAEDPAPVLFFLGPGPRSHDFGQSSMSFPEIARNAVMSPHPTAPQPAATQNAAPTGIRYQSQDMGQCLMIPSGFSGPSGSSGSSPVASISSATSSRRSASSSSLAEAPTSAW